MAIVRGEGVILKFNDGVELVPFGCARSITFNMNADTIGKSTIGSGSWKEYEVVAKGWDFTVEGIVYLEEDGKVTAPDVYQMWDNMTPVNIEFLVVDELGNEVDPSTIKWSQYKDYIPFKVVQGSGDDNALGILKFNFPNKYSVYLHDTNQRYLFSNKKRALSHGCVRVQAWDSLAIFILRNDSLRGKNAVPVDSLQTWLATKQKKYIPVRKPIPLFIRYFTCDVNAEGKLVFYEDIYEEDMKLRETVFANKTL